MYRDNVEVRTSNVHNFVLNHGALGDVITSLPAIIHARSQHNDSLVLKVWVPPWQVKLVEHLLAPYGKFEVQSLTDFMALRKAKHEVGPISLNAARNNTHTRNRVHLVDYAFGFLIDARPESMEQRNYPTRAPLGEKTLLGRYVVFPIGATSDNKLFKAHVMQPIMEWVIERGYDPVLVGTKVSHTRAEMGDGSMSEELVIRDEVDKLPPELVARCIDLREKTDLLQLRDVCGHAAAVVGIDGGTLHLAGTTDTNIVYAMGTTHPKHRYITRHGGPSYKVRYVGPRDLACTGCQSNWTLTSHDFRFCAYTEKPNACMDLLHPDDFISGLKELGL